MHRPEANPEYLAKQLMREPFAVKPTAAIP
jgi:hypothetical protein